MNWLRNNFINDVETFVTNLTKIKIPPGYLDTNKFAVRTRYVYQYCD